MKKAGLIFSLLFLALASAVASTTPKTVQLMLQDSASGLATVTQIGFADGTSPNYVPSEDGPFLLQSPDSTPQIFSFSLDNVACSLNEFGPFTATTVIRIGMAVSNTGTVVFSNRQFSNFDPSCMIFLEDRQLNVFTDLRHFKYSVPVTQTGEFTNRFYLHITYAPVLSTSPAGCLNNDGIIMIAEDSSVNWTACKLYDSVGTMVAIDTNITGNFSFPGLPGGNYTVQFDYHGYIPEQVATVDEHKLVAGLNVSNDHDFVKENIQFYTGSSNATEYIWNFGDGSTITGVANPTYYYLYPGVYTATVNCSNTYGCTVEADTLIYIDEGTAVNSIDGNSVKIFTDNNSIRIDMDNTSGGQYNYDVYSIGGQVIKTGALTTGDVMVDMGADAAGLYIVSIHGGGSVMSQKVVIAR